MKTRDPWMLPHTPEMFEIYQNHFVRLIKKDGYARHGTVVSVKDGFLQLEYQDGRSETIRTEMIGSIADLPSREKHHQRHRNYVFPEDEGFWFPGHIDAVWRFMYIMVGFGSALAGAEILLSATASLAVANGFLQGLVASGVSAAGLALFAIGIYVIIMV